ncbi:discoidin domain-containing protein [Lacrimispora sp. NSJ-141]|uniref:Discoidin domain-containing protein n=1 Tax=Lientehia hominis TaxID=2897778 RepID=A0AAP2RK71_9FIRM|nr:discoidin domain-containing protein [Lientehia hominis]MCD2492420.1 discoidin domain-containing protein [Lientehia hominis]
MKALKIRGKNRKAGRNSRGGYTLVELIVVIVILLILAGATVFGITRWLSFTDFKRQNEYAQTIFVAAQNQLTEYSENGRLSELQAAVSDEAGEYEHVLDVTKLKGMDGEPYKLSEVWPESDKDTTRPNASRYQGEICSLIGTKEDYQNYLAGNAGKEMTALYDMLSAYLYDTSILNAAVCVEFTPEDGQVFAVLYSDKSTGFEYNPDNKAKRNTVDISNRKSDYRKARMIGYYGVDTLSRATSTKTEKPSIGEVRLNNEDTLNFSFRLTKVKTATQELVYEIAVCAKGTKNPLLVFTLDGSRLKNELFKSEVACGVTRYSYDENGKNPTAQKLGDYEIPAWVESDGTVRVVLDAADLGATSSLYYDVYEALTGETDTLSPDLSKFKSTYSFRRFGIKAEDIYCTVQGSGVYYKTTAKKQSNLENAYFGSVRSVSAQDHTVASYAVENGRHLYNIRYMEDYSEEQREVEGYEDLKTADRVIYQLTSDVDWNIFAESGSLFETNEYGETGSVSGAGFPSFKQLRECAVFEGNGGKSHTIGGIEISVSRNQETGLYGDGTGIRPAGLFLKNAGVIRYISLDRITVSGEEQTGAFCGVNSGTLEDLTVLDSEPSTHPSTVTGTEDVGGITGAQENDVNETVIYDGLVNRARVTGNVYVGGIVGRLKAEKDGEILVEGCQNYGPVEASGDDPAEARYIGGITGYSENITGDHDGLIIRDCISSPQYTDSYLEEILGDRAGLEKRLRGVYVGGIVGYNKSASIESCSTEEETGKEGYIFGWRYVGGIAGFSEGSETGIDGSTGHGKSGVNEANVIGSSYVGGIVGCSAGVWKQDDNGILIPKEDRNLSFQVKNWTNKGVVLAADGYAGGIAGYNTGLIFACSSEVDGGSVSEKLSAAASLSGDYAGGIAGYNNGILGNTARDLSGAVISGQGKALSVVCYVAGRNFVGGIAGYNDVDAVIEDYEVAGGYIKGSGCYAGGYAGFNASLALLADENGQGRSISADPNEVTGTYCVGGTVGGNVLAAEQEISAAFQTDNFLGKLTADAFAGGFIGYNRLVAGDTSREEIRAMAETSAGELKNASLEEIAGILDGSGLKTGSARLVIRGMEEGSGTQSKFGGITAQIYAGGVVGYSDKDTFLLIQDVVNLTPVTATGSIENGTEQPGRRTYDGKMFSYSYAGGIIGKVEKNVVLDACRNQDVGDVVSSGTYVGGLCEVNEGIIRNCSVSSIGSGSSDYVGGLTGVNKAGGIIENGRFEKKTVTGRNFVGGIAAENFGTIDGTVVERASVTAYGETGNVGGITGYHYGEAFLTLNQDISVTVTSSGSNVGGVAGTTEGNLGPGQGAGTVRLEGSVSGTGNVGGIAGDSKADLIEGFENEASVSAEDGAAGGIIGKDSGTGGTIRSCINRGSVSSAKSGDAGGIVGQNQGTIQGCKGYGTVSASNGIGGGIAGVNNGNIQGCLVQKETGSGMLSFMGRKYAGGISGLNNGTIADSSVSGVKLTNPAGGRGGALGGISGRNTGIVSGCSVGENGKAAELLSNVPDVSMGGVSGENTGTIEGTNPEYSRVYAQLSFIQTNMSYYGNLGGIAGSNTGAIRRYEFNGTVEGTANDPQNTPEYNPNTDFETNGAKIYGYGGIAGINGSSDAGSGGSISDCRVNVAKVTGTGDPNNVSNIGGVTGVNGQGSSVSRIVFGTSAGEYQVSLKGNSKLDEVKNAAGCVYVGTGSNTSAYAHTGGVAGLNNGTITDIGFVNGTYSDNWDDTSVIVESYRGHVGGITGYNRKNGGITYAATGKKWAVFAPQNGQDNGCGGIIGYSASAKDTLYCINRAAVEKTVPASNGTGGIIGRLECATGSTWSIRYCENYGKVRGANRVGGMVGIWKYYGGTISDCVNYGEIQSDGNEGSSGIVGMLYDIRSTAARAVRCENHGTIRGSRSGGIVGASYGGKAVYMQLQSCVNTGLIQSGDNCGGITGSITNYVNGSYITACNNYGYGIGGGSICGIAAKNTSGLTVSKCFGIADTVCPISENVGDSNNYYLSDAQAGTELICYDGAGKETSQAPNTFYVKKIDAPGILKPEFMRKLVLDTSGLSDGDRSYYSNTQSGTISLSYTFTFSTAIELNSMDLYWNRNGNDGRVTDYTVYYSSYTEGGTWKELASMDNASSGNFTADSKETVNAGSPVEARRVQIVITRSIKKGGAGTNACLIRAHFKGTVSGQDYDGSQGYADFGNGSLTCTKYDGADSSLSYKQSGTVCTYSGAGYETFRYREASGDSGRGRGTGANVLQMGEGSAYRLAVGTDGEQVTLGLPGFSMNPKKEFLTENVSSDTSLRSMGDAEDNIRYQVFLADDPYFDVDASETISSLGVPDGIKMADVGNAVYQAEWIRVPKAAFYEYEAVYYGADGRELSVKQDTVYDTSVQLPVSSIDGDAVRKIVFRVRAGANTIDGNGGVSEIWSSYSDPAEQAVADVLPVPQYHLELVRDGSDLKYQAFLDNQEEYRTFLQERGSADVEADMENIQITVDAGGTDLSFTAQSGKSEGYFGGSEGNCLFSSYAVHKEKTFTSSVKQLRESMAPVSDSYKSGDTDFAQVSLKPDAGNGVGFMGITSDTLSYQLKIRHNKYILYMRSELTALDKELGVPVVLSSSQLRTSDTTSSAVPTSLSSLPEELLDESVYGELMVRSYPSMMSNNIVYTGHTVDISAFKTEMGAVGLSRDELKELYVAENGQVTDAVTGTHLIESGKLAGGFVIELASDGTYTLYYNSLLEYNNHQSFDYPDSGQGKQTQVFYYRLNEEKIKASVPVVRVNDHGQNGTDGDPNEDFLVLTWDLDKDGYENTSGGRNYESGAVYDYVIVGYTADGIAVQLDKGVYVTGTDGENSLIYDITSWNYKKAEISVSRRGKESQSGMTEIFPAGAVKTCEFKLRFSQIAKPVVSLHRNESGIVEKNSLLYDVTWDGIPTAERSELAGYQVTAERSEEDSGAVSTYADENEFEAARQALMALYGGKPGVQSAEEEGKILYSWNEDTAGASISKTMIIQWKKSENDSVWTMERSLETVWIFEISKDSQDAGGDVLTRMIDLNDYERGETLDISVKALAAADAGIYRDGSKGVIRSMTLPSRLDVPDVEEMTGSPAYRVHGDQGADGTEKPFMTQKELVADGIKLVFEPTSESGILQGKYEIAAAVYDSREDADSEKIMYTGDGDGSQAGYWNYGAIETVITKASAASMGGNFLRSEYTMESLSADYAGKWLKIAMRSVSDSNVSSMWSDEDEAADGTVNYKWIRIPRIQTSAPEMEEGARTLYYMDGKWKGDFSQTEAGTDDLAVSQTALTFKEQSYGDGYQVQLVRAGEDSEITGTAEDHTVYYADWIYLEKNGAGGYHVFYSSSVPSFQRENWMDPNAPVCMADDLAVYLGDVGPETAYVKLPYTGTAWESAADSASEVTAISAFQWADGVFTLILPDVISVGSGDSAYFDSAFLFTAHVSARTRVSEENLEWYENSEIAGWYRTAGAAGEHGTAAETREEFQPAPSLTVSLSASSRPGTAYEISAVSDKWLVFEVSVKDGAGGVYSRRRLSAAGAGTSDISSLLLLSDGEYAAFAGKTLDVRAASVDMKTGGLSEWTEWVSLGILPELILEAPVVSETSVSSLNGIINKENRSESVSNLPGKTYSWMSNAKASGYDILSGGQSGRIGLETGTYVLATLTAESNSGGTSGTLSVEVAVSVTETSSGYRFTLTVPDDTVTVDTGDGLQVFRFENSTEIRGVPEDPNYQVRAYVSPS